MSDDQYDKIVELLRRIASNLTDIAFILAMLAFQSCIGCNK